MKNIIETRHQNIDKFPAVSFIFLHEIGSFILPIIFSLDLLPGEVFITRVLKYIEKINEIIEMPSIKYEKDTLDIYIINTSCN